MNKKMIRVLLVDDQKLFRESLRAVLKIRNSNVEVVGQASNGDEGWRLVIKYRPDIILMDIRMPVIDGVESARRVRAKCPEAKIIMLTTFNGDEYIFEALKLGAAGYLLKDIQPEEVETAILTVYHDGMLMSSDITAKLVNKLNNIPETPGPQLQQSKVQEVLTHRECDVFHLLAVGLDNKEIAEKLFLTEGTVRNHVSNIYRKLNLRDRVQAVKYAMEHGAI